MMQIGFVFTVAEELVRLRATENIRQQVVTGAPSSRWLMSRLKWKNHFPKRWKVNTVFLIAYISETHTILTDSAANCTLCFQGIHHGISMCFVFKLRNGYLAFLLLWHWYSILLQWYFCFQWLFNHKWNRLYERWLVGLEKH